MENQTTKNLCFNPAHGIAGKAIATLAMLVVVFWVPASQLCCVIQPGLPSEGKASQLEITFKTQLDHQFSSQKKSNPKTTGITKTSQEEHPADSLTYAISADGLLPLSLEVERNQFEEKQNAAHYANPLLVQNPGFVLASLMRTGPPDFTLLPSLKSEKTLTPLSPRAPPVA